MSTYYTTFRILRKAVRNDITASETDKEKLDRIRKAVSAIRMEQKDGHAMPAYGTKRQDVYDAVLKVRSALEEDIPGCALPPDGEEEFLGQVVDIFEDFLAGKGIRLKHLSPEPEQIAAIYGDDYDVLSGRMRDIFSLYGFLGVSGHGKADDTEVWAAMAARDAVDGFGSFLDGKAKEGMVLPATPPAAVSDAEYSTLEDAVRKLVDDWRPVLGRPMPAYAGVRRAGNETFPYVICYRPGCVRDAQVWRGDADMADPMSGGWEDVREAMLFVGVFRARSEEDALYAAADREGCSVSCLTAVKVQEAMGYRCPEGCAGHADAQRADTGCDGLVGICGEDGCQCDEDGQHAPDDEAAYRLGNGEYLHIRQHRNGYGYTLYQNLYATASGDLLVGPEIPMDAARDEILAILCRGSVSIEEMPMAEFNRLWPTEAIEVCPYCEAENVYPNWDAQKKGYIAKCTGCGKEIFLCDECLHADDNKAARCDWHEVARDGKTAGTCFRGTIAY